MRQSTGFPDDYIRPVWRCEPRPNGDAAIMLDPREAAWVLEHGCTIDGMPYRASRDGWEGTRNRDGTLTVCIFPLSGGTA